MNHAEPQHKNIIHTKVEIALVENLYQQASLGFIASIICSTMIMIFLLYADGNSAIIYTWYILFIAVILTRLMLYILFRRRSNKKTNIKLWRNLFTMGTLLGGIMWGITGTSILLPASGSLVQTFVLVILAGITAGAVPLNS